MKTIENQIFDGERALYASHSLLVRHCSFDGPADGESALKECSDIVAEDCYYNLRYPFWHVRRLKVSGGEMTELCRAALWYCENVELDSVKMHGIKALRECHGVSLRRCDICSPEFGWFCSDVQMDDCRTAGEYFMMRCADLSLDNVTLEGKYAFQYLDGAVFNGCHFDTKDAFWHAHNVTVRNSIIKGEYLAWYSDSLTLENCTVIGTQPLCYCRNLKLIDCKMIDCDLAFEKSDVEASITTPVVSIKNVRSGTVRVPEVGEIIRDDDSALGNIVITGER